jgi:hypothetical protein
VPASDELVVARITDGTADAGMIEAALQRREPLRLSQSFALRRLRAVGGVRSGIAAVILGNVADELRLLAGDDLDATRALLAAARLAGEELPAADVASLFGCSKAIDEAAEELLIANDSPAARDEVRRRHPEELLILGAYAEVPWEQDALRRFIEADLDELIVLWSTVWTDAFLEIEISGGRATSSHGTRSGPCGPRCLKPSRTSCSRFSPHRTSTTSVLSTRRCSTASSASTCT